ncbi:hypothetical protein Q361_12713 [Flavobacterium croceum DSM 17960]|uniref:Uncharacterized protein n=1 Tax=Flavobacterium croceum DSM 17960 TaxID=1121886 RepID=A0A2S4N4W9_9FLAO|nr:hypothetical protein [Flavobacterium croceum]POS00726.1 hypothetical protein Q361_12713 [Flavobacterium croceum DSM 17960]
MPSTSETGNAKNVANFQVLIAFVTAYGSIPITNEKVYKIQK